jgi:hypothetical protein
MIINDCPSSAMTTSRSTLTSGSITNEKMDRKLTYTFPRVWQFVLLISNVVNKCLTEGEMLILLQQLGAIPTKE